ncbi:nuclear RNA export factor 1-like [Ischnura elegans]|uniref:nuclear RNA export factor 1-like n=1 Tax=Ischnura elegans TaxID=197161 RepID=UPI001ED8BE02|nr:nuclear RNA export factor 1-like [Ischnura elegans]
MHRRIIDGGFSRNGGKHYYGHDDRVDNRRRVSFKPGSNRISKHDRLPDRRLPMHVRLDDDVDMAGSSGFAGRDGNRFNTSNGKRGRGRKRQGRNSPAPQNRAKLSETASWFKVTIPYGAKYEKDYILRMLFSHISPTIFIPIAYRTQANEASFYVEDYEAAQKLACADRKMTASDGYKILVRVHPGTPKFDLNPALKAKVTTVMGKRYNADSRALDLTRFHLDPDLVQDSFCALSRPNLMIAVLDIISENIPEMTALNLSENKIHVIDHLSSLSRKTPNLKILHLGRNKIHEMTQLNSLQGLPIVELVLQGNPLCSKFKDQSLYVSEVRKRFPKLVKLDGMDLPPQISFDVTDEINMPTSKGSFISNPEGQPLVRQFLEQYYSLFDAENRQPLLDAYHQNAMFSLSAAYPSGQGSTTSHRLNDYLGDSRNLLKVPDYARRQKLLRKGKLAIVTFLSQLPETQHDPLSFAVDVPICNPQLIYISVSGLFKETKTNREPIRAFNRVFVIVPSPGGGFCIVNEQLFITNATKEQEKAVFKPAPAPVPAMPAEPLIPAQPAAPLAGEMMQEQMVQTMSQQSGMSLDWSRKCLIETGWDFERAVFVFTELHKQGKIPAEAFIK